MKNLLALVLLLIISTMALAKPVQLKKQVVVRPYTQPVIVNPWLKEIVSKLSPCAITFKFIGCM